MQRIEVNCLGFSVTKEVPETTDEYNGLATANGERQGNCVLEDAVANTLYRGTFPKARSGFLKALEVATGILRNGDRNEKGELTKASETEGKYRDRVVATLIANSTIDSEDAFVELYRKDMQIAMDTAKFDPSTRPPSEAKATKEATALAKDAIKNGLAERFARSLSKVLNRSVEADEDSLAIAITEKLRKDAAVMRAKLREDLNNLAAVE